jgi:hypothetical protein
MRPWKRLIYYLMINVLVSACTVLVVLTIWERRNTPTIPVLLPTQAGPASSSGTPISGTLLISGTLSSIAQATPTVTPGPDLLSNVEEYQVQFGDTLGLIAERFEVEIEDLLRVNQINDPSREDSRRYPHTHFYTSPSIDRFPWRAAS